MRMFAYAVALCLTLTISSQFVLPTPAAASNKEHFDTFKDRKILELEGFWRSRGYGWIWHIQKGNAQRYHVTSTTCTKSWMIEDVVDDIGDVVLLRNDGGAMRISYGDPAYLFTFDKIEALPSSCQSAGSSDPVTVFNAFTETFAENYAFFDKRNVDWRAIVKKYRGRITPKSSDRELFDVLSGMLSGIDDAHVGLRASLNGDRARYNPPRRSRPEPRQALENKSKIGYWTRRIGDQLVRGELQTAGSGQVRFGVIDDDIGYLYVGSTGRALREAMSQDRLFTRAKRLFQGKKALIIDLSRNGGGTDYTARRLAAWFTSRRYAGYYKSAHGDARNAPQPIYIEAGKDILYNGPIILITGRSTVSAAEILAMSLRALPNVTHIGARTAGSLSDVLFSRLPNGWTVRLSNEVYLDHRREAWEGPGIKPDIEFPVYREWRAPRDKLTAARGVVNFIRSRLN